MRRRLPAFAALALVLAACSGGGNKSATASSPPPQSTSQVSATASSSSAPAQPDFLSGAYACSLITQAEVAQLYGQAAKPPEANGGRLLAFDGGDTSNCRVESEDGGLILQFTIFRGHTMDVTQLHWTNEKGPPGFLQPLPGIGDDAGFFTTVPMVYALHQFETLEVGLAGNSLASVDPKAIEIGAATLIAPRMGSNASSTAECAVGADGLIPEGQRLSADDLSFEASKDQGTFSGTWKNDTFGTSGTVDANVVFDLNARTATIKFQFKGDTLGIKGDGLAETVVIEIDRPETHLRSATLGDVVIRRPFGAACPTRPVIASADQPSNSSLSNFKATFDPLSDNVNASFDIAYPNGTTSSGSFTLRHQ